ncbi:MAG: GNAT family N-acetyltransferase [Tissierellia bacterium]|nr:GNAT family N-acetyltransferase [Tissierellia bacterium]
MIYYNDGNILVREMEYEDVAKLVFEEVAQGWRNQTADKYLIRLADMRDKKSLALVALYKGDLSGYINIYFEYERQGGLSYPSIVDFGTLIKYRNKGIGTRLMDVAEGIAFEISDRLYLHVGLYEDYGPAQRMYAKRGYLPDGHGLYYDGEIAIPYEVYPNNDDLSLKLYKEKNAGK